MTVAAFERAEHSSGRRHDFIAAVLQQPIELATIATFASMIVLLGQRTATLGFAMGVAMMLAFGTVRLLAQRRVDVRGVVVTGGIHLGVAVLIGTFV